jgi:hypothetical protein
MIPKAAIEKAIEGGWSIHKDPPTEWYEIGPQEQRNAVLDPSFWQALGVARGSVATLPVEPCTNPPQKRRGRPRKPHLTYWQEDALKFYRLVITGQSTEQFWEELLK